MPHQVIFTVNGPGEVSAWLWPITVALRAAHPDIRIGVCLLPCVFSSGSEVGVIRDLGTVDAIASVRDSLAFIRTGRLPPEFTRDCPTLVFHLGGEVALTRLIAWRLRARVYAYAEAPLAPAKAFAKVFYSGLNTLPEKFRDPDRMVGDLMVDAADLRRSLAPKVAKEGPVIGLFPGSRDYMVGFLLPYYAAIVDAVAARRPDLRFVMAKAEFIPETVLSDLPDPPADRSWPALPLRYVRDGAQRWFTTPGGARIEVMTNPEVLTRADIALTIPGTNTGEIAAAGIPMVLVAPLYLGERVPLPGLAGHMGRIPFVGDALKRFYGYKLLHRLDFLALPNRRAGRAVVAEFVGTDLNARIEAEVHRLLAADRVALGAELRAAMGRAGAAERLAQEIGAFFQPPAPDRATATDLLARAADA